MENNFLDTYAINVNIKKAALSLTEIKNKQATIKAAYINRLNFVLTLLILSIGVSFRAISLGYDSNYELFNASIQIGVCFGIFAAIMIDGSIKRRLQMMFVGLIVICAASLFSSMLVTMLVGYIAAWIICINIIASSLATMWLVTYYEEVVRGFDSTQPVNDEEFSYIKKAACDFEELDNYCEGMRKQKRMPLMAEYWAFCDWIKLEAAS